MTKGLPQHRTGRRSGTHDGGAGRAWATFGFARWLLVLIVGVTMGAVYAQDCTLETEPNDVPADADALDGHACLVGEMAGQDQDAYLWAVTEEDAATPWVVETEGIAGQVTKVDLLRVTFADNGRDVTGVETLGSFGTRDGSLQAGSPFLIAPGRYVLGVSKSGGEGQYVVHLRPGEELRRGRRPGQGADTVENAFAHYGMLDGGLELPWTVAADGPPSRWDIELRTALGDAVTLALVAPDGATVAQATTDALGWAALRSLGPGAGDYRIVVRGASAGAPYTLAAVPTGVLTDGDEVEPNDDWSQANVLTLDRPMHAAGPGSDTFVLDVPPERLGDTFDLNVEGAAKLDVRLFDTERRPLQERRGTSGALRGLLLDRERYFVTVRAPDDGAYTLSFSAGAPPEEGRESEPNDALVVADPLPDALTVQGELQPQDKDVYRFTAGSPAQLWRIQVVGAGVQTLATYDAGGTRQASLRGEGRIRLDNLVLLPGEHYIEVAGDEGRYVLRALPMGPVPEADRAAPAPSLDDEAALEPAAAAPPSGPEAIEPAGPPPPPGVSELEPNDDESRAELLESSVVRVGALPGQDDVDMYRFYLASDQYLRIEAVPPADGSVFFDVSEVGIRAQPGALGESAVLERRFLAGNYFLRLRPDIASDGYYQLRMTQLDPLALPADAEPNDDVATANRLPADLVVPGRVGEINGDDFYTLPTFATATTLHVELENDDAGVRLALLGEGAPRLDGGEPGAFDAELPADTPLALRVSGRGRYRMTLAFGAEVDPSQLRPPEGDTHTSASFAQPDSRVAAYWHEGQVWTGELTLENGADRAQSYALQAASSNVDFTPEVPATFDLGPGERGSVPVTVRIAPDARDDQPVRITVGARSEIGLVTTAARIAPACEAPPVAPRPSWALPEPLLGRLDVAWTGLGASVVDDSGRDAELFDGRTSPATGAHHAVGESVTIDLAGDEPILLAGTTLHPQAGSAVRRQLRDFRVLVSLDGSSFTPVLEGRLSAARVEQAFVFEEPVPARYARLEYGADQGGRTDGSLGEWKLIAAEDAPLPAANLADPALGGHVVWSDPLVPQARGHASLLDEEANRPSVDGRGVDSAVWVVGFQHDRAAQVARLEWAESPDSRPEGQFQDVVVEASLTSPVGPWRPLASWELQRDAGGVAVLSLDEPIWARYLRFTARGQQEGARTLFPPDTLRVIERAAGDGYRSILGEWGQYRREAAYEWMRDRAPAAAVTEADDNDTREAAQPLATGEVAEGTVAVAEDVDWYRVTVPDGQNHLQLRLEGDPTIAYRYELTDADGAPVPYEESADGDAVVLRAFVEPGTYDLQLSEPKRSVIFAWDTSGSVGPYTPITYASLARFARDLDPEREYVQLLAFNDPAPIWLLPYWSADPTRAQQAINDFDRDADSSNSELALLTASRALSQREGTRAVLFMTDAESPGYALTPALWRSLEQTRPRVFTFEISTSGSDYSQDLMQSWADVNHGFYDYARNVGDFDVGFARASCLLRRPKRYRVELTTSAETPPGPGKIRVVAGAGATLPAVEVILDASGSMGKKLPDGTSRIDAARGVLRDFVSEVVPEGTPFALRAFGHIKPSSCETRLEMPLAPLDPAAASDVIAAIEPKLLSQTPLADSIAAVAEDLEGAPAGGTLLLLTDGEESCGGDPAAALVALRDAGVDVRLAIVSLGLEEDAARGRFGALAEAAGGSYVDVTGVDALRASVTEAAHPAFTVLSVDGSVVASGRVGGDAVEVPAGVYRVAVEGARTFEDVRVGGDASVELELAAR